MKKRLPSRDRALSSRRSQCALPQSAPRQDSGDLLNTLGERGLLERLTPYMALDSGRLLIGYGDDAAVWDPIPTMEYGKDSRAHVIMRRAARDAKAIKPAGAPLLVLTTDTMVEGTHFRAEWIGWRAAGRKLIASNVSDIAAMGARPALALISLACPPQTRARDIEDLYRGLCAEARRWGVRIIGGDTVRAKETVLTLTLLGEKDRAFAPARRNALRPGQRLFVTGWPGESGAGLALLRAHGKPSLPRSIPLWKRRLIARHATPTPRPAAGQALARAFADLAMIDISDGLDNESRLLAQASRVQLCIDLSRLPVSADLTAWAADNPARRNELSCVLFGGEDYELLFATAAELAEVKRAVAAADSKLPVHEIGRVIAKTRIGELIYIDASGNPATLPPGSVFSHFPSR